MTRDSKALTAFLLLAFGPSWATWEISMGGGWTPGDEQFPLAVLLGAFGPALAAVIVRAFVTREGFADAGLDLGLGSARTRRWYLVAWLWTLPAAAMVLALAALTGLASPDWSLGGGPPGLSEPGGAGWTAWVVNLGLTVPAAVVLLGEELGWRGWLQGRLLPGRPLADAALTGIVWSGWHAPLILRGYDFPGHPVAGLGVFTVSAVLVSVVLGRIKQAGRSIWPVCMAHAAVNTVGMGATTMGFAPEATELWVGFVGVLGWVPLGLAAWWFGRGLKPWSGSLAAEKKHQ